MHWAGTGNSAGQIQRLIAKNLNKTQTQVHQSNEYDHVLTCKKHTGATQGHNHVIDVLAQLAHNTGYSVRVNYKVSTTAAASNKQGDVELVTFGRNGYNSLVIDVSICCDHVG